MPKIQKRVGVTIKSFYMLKFFRKIIGGLFGKPAKCPNCGCEYFHWDHGGPNGENYWKCNECGYMIKD